jgi:hypothetical protein
MRWYERSPLFGKVREVGIVLWSLGLLAFVFYLGHCAFDRKSVLPAARPVAQASQTVADSALLTYRISDSVSIQVTLIPHGKGVNVLILPVTKTRHTPGKERP